MQYNIKGQSFQLTAFGAKPEIDSFQFPSSNYTEWPPLRGKLWPYKRNDLWLEWTRNRGALDILCPSNSSQETSHFIENREHETEI